MKYLESQGAIDSQMVSHSMAVGIKILCHDYGKDRFEFVAVSEIPAAFMLNKNNPSAESSGCVTVKRERYSWVKTKK